MSQIETKPKPESGTANRWAPNRVRVLLAIASFGAYATALVFAARRWDLPPITGRVVALLAVALVFELFAKVLMSILFQDDLRRAGDSIRFSVAFKASLAGSAVSRLLPAGGALTPSAMGWAARIDAANAAGAALRASVLTYGGLLAGTGAVVVWGASTGRHPFIFAGQVIVGSGMIALGIGVLAGGKFLPWVVSKLPRRLRDHFGATVVGNAVRPKELALVVMRVASEAAVLWSALLAFGIDLTPTQTVVAYGVSTIVGGAPGLPGGLGLIEGGLIGIIAAFGFSAGMVVAPVLVYRVVDYWIIAGIGLIAGGVVMRDLARTEVVIDLRAESEPV